MKKKKKKLIDYCKNALEKYTKEKLQYEIHKKDYYYSYLILNKFTNYTENIEEILNELKTPIFYNNNKLREKLIYIYFYLNFVEDLNYTEEFKNRKKETKEELKKYFIEVTKDIKNIEDREAFYYYLCLVNYFNIKIDKDKINKLDYKSFNSYLDLLEPNLSNTYFKIHYAITLNLLSQEEKDFLIKYYESLLTKEGFRSYTMCNSQNINYAFYLLLNLLENKDYKGNEYIKYKKIYLPSKVPIYNKYKNEREVFLYLSSLIQGELNKKIDTKLKKEVIKRLISYDKQDKLENEDPYLLLLIAKKFNFENEIKDIKYLKEDYLYKNFKKNIETSVSEALKYFDILTLYYPNNSNIDNFYEEIKVDVNKYLQLKDKGRTTDFMGIMATLKTIELRIGKFEENIDIDKILENFIKKVDNFVIIENYHTNNLEDYYNYFYLKKLIKDKNINKNYIFN